MTECLVCSQCGAHNDTYAIETLTQDDPAQMSGGTGPFDPPYYAGVMAPRQIPFAWLVTYETCGHVVREDTITAVTPRTAPPVR